MAGTPKIAMITGNLVAWDGRAQKIARSLRAAGCDVTLIGRSSTGFREAYLLEEVNVVELPPRASTGGWRQRHLVDLAMLLPLLDELEPDVVHAHAVETLGLAVAAKLRRKSAGRRVRVIYDAHEHVAGVDRPDPTWRLAMLVEEHRHIADVDGIMTVSEPLAELLQERYGLLEKPVVVTNAPERSSRAAASGDTFLDVRAECRLDPDVPLLVYSGAVAPARGLATVVAALTQLDGVHLALQVAERHRYVTALERQAVALGVRDRVHIVPYVAPDRVVDYVGTATAGVIPLLHTPNHEVALCNKYLEFMHSRLPIIVSDVRLQAELTRRLGNGKVFRAADVASFVETAGDVLADVDRWVAAYDIPGLLDEHSWEAQRPALMTLYQGVSRLTPDVEVRASPPRERREREVAATGRNGPLTLTRRAPSLTIGPANMAGQAWAWARALKRRWPEFRTEVYTLGRDTPLRFQSDHVVTQKQWRSPGWHVETRRHILRTHTHVLFEGALALTGQWSGDGYFTADAAAFAEAGLSVGLVFHGADIRNPRRHRQLYPDSPFADPHEQHTAALQVRYDALLPLLEGFRGPCFVSTPDLLDFLPSARWLPITVDTDLWRQGRDVMRREKPIVLHAPSKPAMKGSIEVDAVARQMHSEGLIEYRRPGHVPPDRMPEFIRDADIVLDQFSLGTYGVLAVEAMAAARIVVGHVAERVRARFGEELPIVESRREDLRRVLTTLLEDREQHRRVAARGPQLVREYHDGTRAAGVLADYLVPSNTRETRKPGISGDL